MLLTSLQADLTLLAVKSDVPPPDIDQTSHLVGQIMEVVSKF